MDRDTDRIRELEHEVRRLTREVDRLRLASEDAMQQLDWCIGYFTGSNRLSIAKSLGANRAYIRRHLMKRAEERVPTDAT